MSRADRIVEQTEVARLIKQCESDEHFSGYFQEYLRDMPDRIKHLDADDFKTLLHQIVYDYELWKADIDYEMGCGDDYAHGDVWRDVLKKRIFGSDDVFAMEQVVVMRQSNPGIQESRDE